ncbi:hypothetical protein, partial [Brucella pseudogrignonensis]|uniref:hypothetical protein n=1 Tax=Brucella pseudogrignonensis TaxID=419475 RepID=UPI003F50691C
MSINDPQDSFAVGSPSFTQDAAAYINLRNNAAECNSNNKSTQTNSVLFYRPAGVNGVGATSLSLGGEIYVNGLAMLNGYVHIPMATLQMGRDTGAGFKIGSTTTRTVHAGDIAIGGQASADGSVADGAAQGFAVAIGNNSEAIGTYALGVGTAAKARGQRSTALGPSTQAEGYSALAAGRFAQAYGPNTTAVGRNAVAGIANQLTVAEGAVAVGYGARARAENAIAVGRNALVEQNIRDAMALGFGATAENDFGVALGSNARTGNMVAYPTATLAGTVYNFAGGAPHAEFSVGSLAQQRQGTNFASGRISSDSTDAINGSQLFAAFSEIGKTHMRVEDLEARMEALPAPGTNAGQTGVAESVRAAIGDGAVINDAGALVMPEITLKSLGATVDGNGNTIPAEQPNTLLGAIAALDNEMVKNDRAIGAIIDSALLWHPEKNAFDAERIIPQLDGDGKQLLDSEGNPLSVRENGKITNLAPGAVTPQSSDAVTGGQLSDTNNRVSDLATKADRLGEDALLWNETAGTFDARHGTSQANRISNIADGVLPHDAVNLGQLQTVAAVASTAQSAADNARTAADHAQASADDAQTTANTAQDRADRALSAADRAGAQLAGMGADETVLGRIEDAGKATASALGGGATINTDGRITAPEYKVAAIDRDGRVAETPKSHSNVGAAVAALDTNIGTVNDRVSDLATKADRLGEDALLWNETAGAFDARHGTSQTNRISNIADGVLTHDAVNLRQLQTVAAAASTAQSAADNARTAADHAQASADDAQTTANTAQDRADRALSAADRAGAQLAGMGADETVLGRIEDAGKATASALGGGATVNTDGRITAPEYKVAAIDRDGRVAETPKSHSNVGAAVAALDTNIGTVNDRVSDLATKADRLGEDALLWNETAGAFDARHGTSQANRISNIADGVLPHDAVNLGQLQTVAAVASTAQSAADNARTAADHAQASADDAQTTANTAQDRADRALSAADRAGAQLAGMGADETVLGRIEDAGKATASALGGGATINTDGRITAPEYKVAAIDRDGRVAETPKSHSNVGAAVAALDTNIGTVNDRVSDLATKADRLGEDALLWNETAGAFDARHGTSQTNRISNIADGVLTHDAVNLRQLQTVAAAASTAQSAADNARTAADHAQAS